MIGQTLGLTTDRRRRAAAPPHVLVVIADRRARLAIVRRLEAVAIQVTTASAFGLAERLRDEADAFDLLLTAQSPDEMTMFGLPQLVRSAVPALPILVVETGTAQGEGVVSAALGAIERWAPRGRRPLH